MAGSPSWSRRAAGGRRRHSSWPLRCLAPASPGWQRLVLHPLSGLLEGGEGRRREEKGGEGRGGEGRGGEGRGGEGRGGREGEREGGREEEEF